MPGVLTHLVVSLAGFLSASLIFKKWKYGLAFVIGHLIPDIIRFGVTGLANGKWSFDEIISNPLYWTLSFTHYFSVWIIISALAFLVIFNLYKLKKIDKSKLEIWLIIDLIFLMGIVIHLVLDILILEKSYWI